jgi:hypothetical protein
MEKLDSFSEGVNIIKDNLQVKLIKIEHIYEDSR